ncbi:MAG: hypothetical protein ABI165_20450 [Bryobacteraceae bacterium]
MLAPGPLAAPVLAPGVVVAAVPVAVELLDMELEADDEVEEEAVLEELPAVEELGVVAGAALKLRTLSERLPRNCGPMTRAKFSAPVDPERRRMDSRGPDVMAAVRRVATGAAADSTVAR